MSQKELPPDQGFLRMSEIPADQLEGIVSRATIQKLTSYEQVLLERGEQGLLDWLRNNAKDGVNPLAKQIGLSSTILRKFYDHLGIPRPSLAEVSRRMWEARWHDPEFVKRHAEWSKKSMQERWQDETFRERRVAAARKKWENPKFREERAEALRINRRNPDFNEKMNQAITEARQAQSYKEGVSSRTREMWEDSEFRERQAGIMQGVYADPEYRRKQLEGARRKLEDTEWLARRAEATRRVRLNPDNIGRYKLPTIQGERRDIGFYTQSAWEANIARVLMYCERDFYPREAFSLSIPPKYQESFTTETTELNVDFITLDPRGNLQVYEIMAHPAENPIGWMKLELLISQYPSLNVRPIIPKFYGAIRRHFERRINGDPRFAGWETSTDNLRNNPEKYAVEGE